MRPETPSPPPNTAAPAQVTPGPEGLISFNSPIDQLAFLADLVERFGDVVR